MAEQLTEGYFYLLFTGLVACVLFVLAGLGYTALSIVRRRGPSLAVVARIGVCFALAFVIGAPVNGAWYALFTERLYHDADPLVRFMPFLPFTLDTSCGAYLRPGVSFLHMEALWLLLAAPCWFFAYAGTRLVWRRAAV